MYSHLANTGMLNSGEVGFEQGLQGAADSLDRYNQLTSLQNTLAGDISTNTNNQQTLLDAVTNAVQKAQASGTMPGPTKVTVGKTPASPNPPGGPYHGSSLAPGTYFNAAGSGVPNYQPTRIGSLATGVTYQNTTGAGLPSYKPVQATAAPTPTLPPTMYASGDTRLGFNTPYFNAAGSGVPNYQTVTGTPLAGNVSYG